MPVFLSTAFSNNNELENSGVVVMGSPRLILKGTSDG